MALNSSAFPPGSLAGRFVSLLPPSRAIRRNYARGEAVFRQGDRADALFLVEAGRVRLTRSLEDGSSVTLHVADAGESFAEASLSARHYHCDAVAETDSLVVVVPKADLLTALAAEPGESLALAAALATQVRDLRTGLELRNIRSAPARVLAWLRLHASGNPPAVSLRRSWSLIAEELGLTREAVYRALAALERQGCIRRDDGTIGLLGLSSRTHRL